jgi:hypothetical protein
MNFPSSPSGMPAGEICQLSIASRNSFQFVAVPDGIAITHQGIYAQGVDNINMVISGLCRGYYFPIHKPTISLNCKSYIVHNPLVFLVQLCNR